MRVNIPADKWPLIIAIALALVFLTQGLFGNLKQSITWDETSYISAGYVYLKHSDFRLNPSHPPLMQELAALPLLFLNLKSPSYNESWFYYKNPVLAYGKAFLFDSGNDIIKIAFWARLPALLLGTCLIMCIFLWGRSLFGAVPALASTAVAAFCPNLIAHSKVATEDMGCAALMFAALWTFWLGWQKKGRKYWIACGLITGFALLAKYTALLLVPIYVIITISLVFLKTKPKDAFLALLIVGSVSFFVVGAGYNFTFNWQKYISGIASIYGDIAPGYSFYLLGKVSESPWWYYNLVGLVTKLPVASMALLFVAVASCLHYRGSRSHFVFILTPVAVIILVSFFDKMNIGLRRILPVIPFLYLFTSLSLISMKSRVKNFFVVFLLAVTAFEAISVFPYHLSFFNLVAGGPKNGPNIFDDSNIDWGQDLPALAELQKQNKELMPIKLYYFGSAEPRAYGIIYDNIFKDDIINPKPGFYAVSVHNLIYLRKIMSKTGGDLDWLTKYTVYSYAGYSIYIYKF